MCSYSIGKSLLHIYFFIILLGEIGGIGEIGEMSLNTIQIVFDRLSEVEAVNKHSLNISESYENEMYATYVFIRKNR